MIDTFLAEFAERNDRLIDRVKRGDIAHEDFYALAVAQLELMKRADPANPEHASRQAEFYHLGGHLRQAGACYRGVFEIEPLMPLSEKETASIRKFCPQLMINPRECFPLKDVVAIHHPDLPLIGYHLFWEDDYDFPDDYEPCDHEEIWVEYDPLEEKVVHVMCWFHSRVIQSEEAAEEARLNGQRPIVRIEWGKHGSLLCGWERMSEPLTQKPLKEWLRETYERVKAGGRLPDHPLKRFWPAGFDGTFEDYIDFSVPVDPLEWLRKKPLLFKTRWVNAAIFTHALLYNFHPKMEWPNRFRF